MTIGGWGNAKPIERATLFSRGSVLRSISGILQAKTRVILRNSPA